MPIPIPPALDGTTQSSLGTENNPTTSSTNTTNPSFSSSTPSQSDNDRPLSKEEADRLYEERMEEEATQTITIPDIQIPTSVESVLRTALPTFYLSQIADPSARASIVSEIRDGLRPEWYSTLPADVKHFFSTAYTAAGVCHAKSRGGVPAPAPTGLGPGVMGVAAVMGVMNAL
ncbi:uncharacterized protein BO95DRAFT_464259 [Aspergillus brunneoviolaceus CBS 621.78]|uniref:Uncharacterized protein n=1 Tax=Aspergillus brunneoviolaceus CBS 621.78 TaxID=1450534 RepID=A0ACD1G7H4_9EURO|nr:hypothetical protein BO95DRAFT_464259 [Aspergillus brunneoviolaceus CBS 621.78]RAH45188.1 hypothetical protein BO95DRAFT_464259 [Aspergillus brunneoviolaceus CBS 621.78]